METMKIGCIRCHLNTAHLLDVNRARWLIPAASDHRRTTGSARTSLDIGANIAKRMTASNEHVPSVYLCVLIHCNSSAIKLSSDYDECHAIFLLNNVFLSLALFATLPLLFRFSLVSHPHMHIAHHRHHAIQLTFTSRSALLFNFNILCMCVVLRNYLLYHFNCCKLALIYAKENRA